MTVTKFLLVVIAAQISIFAQAESADLEIVNEWGVFEFATPHGYPTNNYRPGLTVPTSFEIAWDRIFLAIPRLYAGIPATLAVIPRNRIGHPGLLSPLLQAYPSWDWHIDAARGQGGSRDNCTGLINVYRMRLDKCNRLWVLDSGVADTFENLSVPCPPKILVFDLSSDLLVKRIVVPAELVRRNSLLTNIVLDDFHQRVGHGLRTCDHGLIAYLSDSSSPQIIVYDVEKDNMWSISHPYMYPDPDHGTYTLDGVSFTLMDGILGMALTPPGILPRRLFFQPLASDRIFSIETAHLLRGPNPGDDADLPVRIEGTKSSQAAGMIFSPIDQSLYFSPISETTITAWHPSSSQPRIVGYNPELMQFVLDFRSAELDDDTIWFMSTKLHRFVKQTVDPLRPHIRLIRILRRDHLSRNQTLPYFF